MMKQAVKAISTAMGRCSRNFTIIFTLYHSEKCSDENLKVTHVYEFEILRSALDDNSINYLTTFTGAS